MRSRRVELLWLVLTAFLLLLSAWWLPGSGSLNTDSYSVSFAGRKVLFQTVSRLEQNVFRSHDQLVPREDAIDRQLILGPARYPTTEEWDELYLAVRNGSTLVFAASTSDPHVDAGPFRARVTSDMGIASLGGDSQESDGKSTDRKSTDGEASTKRDATDADESENEPAADSGDEATSDNTAGDNAADDETSSDEVADDEPQRFDPFSLRGVPAETELVEETVHWKSNAEIETDTNDWEVLLTVDGQPQVVRREFGLGTFVLVASDEIFSNGAMLEADRALLAYRILESGGDFFEATWFDETLNDSGAPKVLGIIFAAEFRPITLQLLLILILFGWLGARRFGPAEQSRRSRRRSIVEHAEAVGILYYRAAAGGRAVKAQREFLRQELRRLCGPGFRVDDPAAVARQAQTVEADVRELFETVDGIEAFDATVTRSKASKLLRQLSTLIARVRKDSTADNIV